MSKRSREDICFDVEDFKRCHDVTDDYMILGIDEAGRGPVIGPMVYCGGMVTLAQHDDLITVCGVADSKTMTEEGRNSSLSKLLQVDSFQSFVELVSAEHIAATSFGRSGRTLNTLSHNAAINIILRATEAARGKLVGVFVDTVGIPEAYQRLLSGRFPHLRIVVSKKADSKFPIVSAASIVAKTERDRLVDSLGIPCGNGYPSDPNTKRWIASHLHQYFGYAPNENFVRQSWKPIARLMEAHCEKIEFENDVKSEDAKQPRLSFKKPPPRRDSLFTHVLGLKLCVAE